MKMYKSKEERKTEGLPLSIAGIRDELLGLEEKWGCLRPLEKGNRGFLNAGLMDLTIMVAAGL